MYSRLLIYIFHALFITGCSMAPSYERPPVPLPNQYTPPSPYHPENPQGSLIEESSLKNAALIGWRDFFADPYLHQLIETALTNNQDLKTAVLKIAEARLQYNIQSYEQLPTLNGTGGYTASRAPLELRSSPMSHPVTRSQTVGVGLTSFELDLFGRVESLKDEAIAHYLATEEDWHAAHISLVAEVANTYFMERSYAEQHIIHLKNLENSKQALKLAQARFEIGDISLSDLHTQQGILEMAQASLEVIERNQRQALNALSLLVGGPLPQRPSSAPCDLPQNMPPLPEGLPSELLCQRPDIRKAEQELKGANAHIGAARGAFFPKLSLTAGLGMGSVQLSHLFKGNSRAWSFIPSLTLPIFDWGNALDGIDLAETRKNISIVAYEKAIQGAFREVSDGLVARETLEKQLQAQRRYTDTVTARATLVEHRYQQGIDSLIDKLKIDQEVCAAQLTLSQLQYNALSNGITLYKALGGGIKERTITKEEDFNASQGSENKDDESLLLVR